jgi:hypothetical protein
VIRDFFRDSFATALAPTDLLLHIMLPILPGQPKMVYRKLRHRASGYAYAGPEYRGDLVRTCVKHALLDALAAFQEDSDRPAPTDGQVPGS